MKESGILADIHDNSSIFSQDCAESCLLGAADIRYKEMASDHPTHTKFGDHQGVLK